MKRETPTGTMSVTLDAKRRKINLLIQHSGRVYYVSKANYVQKLKDMSPVEINFCNWNFGVTSNFEKPITLIFSKQKVIYIWELYPSWWH